MIFSDKTYNTIKWIVIIVLPALASATIGVGEVFGWQQYTDPASKCIAILQTLLAAIFCFENAHYNAAQKVTIADFKEEVQE